MLNIIRKSRLALVVAVVGCWMLCTGSIWQQLNWQVGYSIHHIVLYPLLLNFIVFTSLTLALFRKRVLGWVIATVPIALAASGLFLGLVLCAHLPSEYIETILPKPVPAALDLETCNVLARDEFERSSTNDALYIQALEGSQIVLLRNGTFISQGDIVTFTKHRLTDVGIVGLPSSKVFQWITPSSGPYKGESMCVSRSKIYIRNTPM